MVALFMQDINTGYCKYLLSDNQCGIKSSRIKDIPQRDLEYWKRECISYPNPDNSAHVPPVHELLPSCGFKMNEVK